MPAVRHRRGCSHWQFVADAQRFFYVDSTSSTGLPRLRIMLIRIVRLTLHPERVADFRDHFRQVAPLIRQQPGCAHLELWRDADYPSVMITHSHWQHDDDLQAYRQSDLFRDAWQAVKPMFAARPQAFSAQVAHPADTINAAVEEA